MSKEDGALLSEEEKERRLTAWKNKRDKGVFRWEGAIPLSQEFLDEYVAGDEWKYGI